MVVQVLDNGGSTFFQFLQKCMGGGTVEVMMLV
jgi:hypothetical protein